MTMTATAAAPPVIRLSAVAYTYAGPPPVRALRPTDLVIQRGELQATIHGEFHAALVCYRPRCRKLNVLRLSTVTRPVVATA